MSQISADSGLSWETTERHYRSAKGRSQCVTSTKRRSELGSSCKTKSDNELSRQPRDNYSFYPRHRTRYRTRCYPRWDRQTVSTLTVTLVIYKTAKGRNSTTGYCCLIFTNSKTKSIQTDSTVSMIIKSLSLITTTYSVTYYTIIIDRSLTNSFRKCMLTTLTNGIIRAERHHTSFSSQHCGRY